MPFDSLEDLESQDLEMESQDLESEELAFDLLSVLPESPSWDFRKPCWARAQDLELKHESRTPGMSAIDAALAGEQRLSHCCRCFKRIITHSWKCNGPCRQRTYCIVCVILMHPGRLCENRNAPAMIIRSLEDLLPESDRLPNWKPDGKMQCGHPGCNFKSFEKNEYVWICQKCPRKYFHNECWAHMHPWASLTAPNRSDEPRLQHIQEDGGRDLPAGLKYPSECYSCPRCKGPVMPVRTTENGNRMEIWKCISRMGGAKPCITQFEPRGNVCIGGTKRETVCDYKKNQSCSFSGTNFCTRCVLHKPPENLGKRYRSVRLPKIMN
ncbi:Protein of unknown function [Pyronema omphalodes CBS 100304]|uniref:Uncharacterized protein n=1 Tax=Pyronema omphalodes (strain CBS 100304) TaxID=1076935 RepID=U4LLG3_PYROM|nr:Protein of unknown function [Pyronema omphalodes CBS 100304]